MRRLLFSDDRGVVYDHPGLLAAARSGDDLVRSRDRPVPLPQGGRLCWLPGRRPVGFDPGSGRAVVLHRVEVGRSAIVPHAVGATLPPGYTRTLLPAVAGSPPGTARRPVLPQWAYTAAAQGDRGPVVWAVRTDRRRHWSPAGRPDPHLSRRAAALGANPIYRQLTRCALEWNCFTAQNTLLGRDEGAIPSSSACNAHCVGCLSEQAEGMPPPSHQRIAAPPSPEEMAEVGARHLSLGTGRVMISFGQGCEGEPLLRWRAISRAIRLIRAATARGSVNVNTNGSVPGALAALAEAGLDACRISLNSPSPDLYAAYYRPVGYTFADVERSMGLARSKGLYLALNLLTFPGVSDREEEVERLCRLVRRVGADQVQTRSLAMDPDVYLGLARGAGGRGRPLGIPALLEALRGARPGLVVGNFARALRERVVA